MGESPAEDYFTLEDTVTAAVESGTLGFVDGNDIGQGEFTIFLIGPNGRALLRAVRPLLPAGLIHPGAHAVIRAEKDDEVAQKRIALTRADRRQPKPPTPWKPLGFVAIKGGDSAEVEAFWVPLWRLSDALPISSPSTATAARLIVMWHVAGEVWDRVDDEVSVKVESRRERILGGTVPVQRRPWTLTEVHAFIRESLARVLEMSRALVARKRLDWDLADIERTINDIDWFWAP